MSFATRTGVVAHAETATNSSTPAEANVERYRVGCTPGIVIMFLILAREIDNCSGNSATWESF